MGVPCAEMKPARLKQGHEKTVVDMSVRRLADLVTPWPSGADGILVVDVTILPLPVRFPSYPASHLNV